MQAGRDNTVKQWITGVPVGTTWIIGSVEVRGSRSADSDAAEERLQLQSSAFLKPIGSPADVASNESRPR